MWCEQPVIDGATLTAETRRNAWPAALATLDHITPVAEGKDNRSSNLVTACYGCNNARGDLSVFAYAQRLAAGSIERFHAMTRVQGAAQRSLP